MQMIAFDPNSGTELAKEARYPWPPNQAVQDDFAQRSGGIVYLDNTGEFIGQHTVATIVDGQIVAVTIDQNYIAPTPEPNLIHTRLEALESAVSSNLLASAHDRRWLLQKERAKLFGIPWLKEHPEAEQHDLEMAVMADLTSTFPGQAIVVNGQGIIQSYIDEAFARGYIAEAAFLSLRDLVINSSPTQMQTMLQVL